MIVLLSVIVVALWTNVALCGEFPLAVDTGAVFHSFNHLAAFKLELGIEALQRAGMLLDLLQKHPECV